MEMNAFESYATPFLEAFKTPGTMVALSNPKYQQSFGYRNVEGQQPIDEDTIFGIGSVTKVMTCMAIMKLQEEGKLSVHDTVTTYAPEFSASEDQRSKDMTIHHMMTHTSGLPPLDTLFYANKKSVSNEEFKAMSDHLDVNTPSIDTEDEFFSYLRSKSYRLLADPGEVFSYSNDGYSILGYIIERVSGLSYADYMQDEIFSPAGMKRTFFSPKKLEDYENVAMLYTMEQKDNEAFTEASPTWWDAPTMWSAGYVKSTAKDMLLFGNQLIESKATILSADSLKQLTTQHVQIEPDLYYGYGIMIRTDFFGRRTLEHAGGIKGVSAQLTVLPDEKTAGVCLTNIAGAPASSVLESALKVAIGESPDTPTVTYEDVELSNESKQFMLGTYKANEGQSLEIVEKDNKIFIVVEGQEVPARMVGEQMLTLHMYGMEHLIQWNGKNLLFGFRQLERV
ncbi:serine hydrolase domain-containing protein [Geomicrobium sediminis]|uniref:CubicO group peptidase (Beta-lactamase class C family) n=1 Tax=Geomicrobium sediminis TaxID=1347788 RepID=A0ABS2PAA7_9BACL|nr:serine hydrolase domain-containing protein [Geomicrobium sediminis]MBM7632291.1 CubicO group peptidase (beta-lactamase class C family) [Geomicrobium sediminis]